MQIIIFALVVTYLMVGMKVADFKLEETWSYLPTYLHMEGKEETAEAVTKNPGIYYRILGVLMVALWPKFV
jgi:hypothetical protein